MVEELAFDWDKDNVRHLKRHRVTPEEFEEVLLGEPLHMEYQTARDEERFKSLGPTNAGRILVVVWTPREQRIRAVTAYRASKPLQRLYRDHGR